MFFTFVVLLTCMFVFEQFGQRFWEMRQRMKVIWSNFIIDKKLVIQLPVNHTRLPASSSGGRTFFQVGSVLVLRATLVYRDWRWTNIITSIQCYKYKSQIWPVEPKWKVSFLCFSPALVIITIVVIFKIILTHIHFQNGLLGLQKEITSSYF